jgi:pimeloyl-ACP methyl ester carboxylesterase
LIAELLDLRRRDHALDPSVLTVPVLVGRGGLSSARLRTGAELLVARVPGAELADIDTAGHGAHLTHPDEFARFVRHAVALADPSASLR